VASSASGQDESNPALWLATRAGKMELSCPLGTTRCVPQEKIPRKPHNKSFIDQACSVKTGYWPHSFLRIDGPRLLLGPLTRKKKNLARNIQPSWPHTLFQWPSCNIQNILRGTAIGRKKPVSKILKFFHLSSLVLWVFVLKYLFSSR